MSDLPPSGPLDFNRLLSEATVRLSRDESPEEVAARLARAEHDARFTRWTRGTAYAVLTLVALVTGSIAMLSEDSYRRTFGRDVALLITTGMVGYFLGRSEGTKP